MKLRILHILFGLIFLLITACDRPVDPMPPPAPAPEAPALNYHALVIGIGQYGGTGWPQLGTARADAQSIGQVLRKHYGFEVSELTDRQATRGNILRALDQTMKLGKNDALLIFFAGHGYYDSEMAEGYWIPFGAKRSCQNLPAKEDWIWNSSIARIISASPARHILLIVDTCYGGSLFRGEFESKKSLQWYKRAMSIPSRGLISSGNLEPVLDSGIHHSVFAQELLHYLEYSSNTVFSASDIAVSIRGEVSRLTGQLVRTGPLDSPTHAGGEFVFIRRGTNLSPTTELPAKPVYRNAAPPPAATSLQQIAIQIQQPHRVRPRVLACFGPTGEDPETTRIRNQLHQDLNEIGGCLLVERNALDTLLQEIKLVRADLADRRAATEIGKLLPASLILFGEVIPVGDRQKEIHLRVVDTETSRVLCSSSASFSTRQQLPSTCRKLAQEMIHRIRRERPIWIPAQSAGKTALKAGWGRFHGGRIGDAFEIVSRENLETIAPKETRLGRATLESIGEDQSIFRAEWATTNHPATLWLKEIL